MKKTGSALLVTVFLAACGGKKDVDIMASPADDPRPLAGHISDVRVEPAFGGAIVRARAVPPTQGWWDAELVLLDKRPADGVFTYDFRMKPPKNNASISSEYSRQITAGAFISNVQLENMKMIRVQGAQNMITARR